MALMHDARAAGTSRVPKLKITEIRGARFRKMGGSFVRVYTDQGITGTGEMVNESSAPELINRIFAPAFKGRDPLDIERIYFDNWSRVYERGLGGPYTFGT
jgi:L-alanine-DL-glutamate epimerase-like enolase superfamily enzyme